MMARPDRPGGLGGVLATARHRPHGVAHVAPRLYQWAEAKLRMDSVLDAACQTFPDETMELRAPVSHRVNQARGRPGWNRGDGSKDCSRLTGIAMMHRNKLPSLDGEATWSSWRN